MKHAAPTCPMLNDERSEDASTTSIPPTLGRKSVKLPTTAISQQIVEEDKDRVASCSMKNEPLTLDVSTTEECPETIQREAPLPHEATASCEEVQEEVYEETTPSTDFSITSLRSNLSTSMAAKLQDCGRLRDSAAGRSGVVADLTRLLAATSVTDPDLLGPYQCSAIVVNYISAGYILLPRAFYEAGYLYSSFVLVVVALQSYITSIFILETCARAESQKWLSSRHSLPGTYAMTIRDTQFELSALQHMFLGPRWTRVFLATTACDLYSITWVMSTIFGSALAEQVPIAGIDNAYRFWVGLFLLITVPLSCTHVLDQVLLQFIFLGGRMLMVLFMIGTIIVAFMDRDGDHFGDQLGGKEDAPVINLTSTITIVQTAIFATAFQFSVPSMAGISSSKASMTGIFRHAVTFVYVSNCLLAVLMAIYFGSSVNPSSNLNWMDYHTGSEGWSKFVSGYVVLFAALDGLAVFPLLCSTLGGILFAGVFGEKAALTEQDWKTQVFFRLLASLPQSIGALFVSDLGVLAKYGGVFTLLSYSAAPTILYIASGRAMREKGLPEATSYSSKLFSHDWVAYCLLVLTTLAIVGVAVDAIIRNS